MEANHGKVTESNFDAAAAETDPGYGQLFAVLMQTLWLLGVLCSVLSVATILTLIAKPTYLLCSC